MTTLASEGANAPSNTGLPAGSGGQPQRIEGRTPLQLAWIRLKRDKVSMAAGITIVLLILMAISAPLLAKAIGVGPYVQDRVNGLTESGIPRGPSMKAWFGYDAVGRDILVRIIYGSRVSLFIGVVSTSIALWRSASSRLSDDARCAPATTSRPAAADSCSRQRRASR